MRQYRSVFISDVHLGTADCQADYLLDFLNNIQCQTLYLVGDIVDLIAMQRRAHFPDSHRQVIHKLLELAATGTRVVYIPGNHDEFFRRFCGQTFSGIELQYKAVHTTADDRQFLVCHGDQFDQVVRCSPLMLLVGDRAHGLLLRLNRWFNALRRLQGKPYWSLAAWIKSRIGKARTFIRRFELAALTAAEKATITVLSAAISTRRASCAAKRGGSIAMMATGWNTAPRWWSVKTVGWNCCTGPNRL